MKKTIPVWLLTVLALVTPGPTLVLGQNIDAGPEIWVDGPENVDFTGDDRFPDVGVDDSGRRIHVWTNFFPTTTEAGAS